MHSRNPVTKHDLAPRRLATHAKRSQGPGVSCRRGRLLTLCDTTLRLKGTCIGALQGVLGCRSVQDRSCFPISGTAEQEITWPSHVTGSRWFFAPCLCESQSAQAFLSDTQPRDLLDRGYRCRTRALSFRARVGPLEKPRVEVAEELYGGLRALAGSNLSVC